MMFTHFNFCCLVYVCRVGEKLS